MTASEVSAAPNFQPRTCMSATRCSLRAALSRRRTSVSRANDGHVGCNPLGRKTGARRPAKRNCCLHAITLSSARFGRVSLSRIREKSLPFSVTLKYRLTRSFSRTGVQSGTRFLLSGLTHQRNNLRGPGCFGADMSLAKVWKLTESQGLRFSSDAFNVTNAVRFDVGTLNQYLLYGRRRETLLKH